MYLRKLTMLLALMPLVVLGQQTFPLVKDGGIWRESYGFKREPPDPWLYFNWQWVQEGDTVFNNQTYKKLYHSNYGPTVIHKDFYGGVREDSVGRVYFYTDTNQYFPAVLLQSKTEYLLYDFSLKIGDTLQVINMGNMIQILTSIDTMLINNQLRKRYIYNYNREVIEGIGSVKGLFYPLVYEFEHGQTLNCYEDSGVFWTNPILLALGINCFNVGIDESKQGTDLINIYPVPVSDILHIVLDHDPKDQIIIQLLDITGRLIKDYYFYGEKAMLLDVTGLKQGAYIMQVTSNSFGSKSFKIMKN